MAGVRDTVGAGQPPQHQSICGDETVHGGNGQDSCQLQRAMGDGGAWSPAIEVKEQEGNLLITAELPGLMKEDVKVHIDGATLVVEGERKQEKEEKREGYYHSERSYGKYYRSIPLPEGAKTEQTAAQFDNGVLQVKIPIPETRAKRQDIPIHEGSKKAA